MNNDDFNAALYELTDRGNGYFNIEDTASGEREFTLDFRANEDELLLFCDLIIQRFGRNRCPDFYKFSYRPPPNPPYTSGLEYGLYAVTGGIILFMGYMFFWA